MNDAHDNAADDAAMLNRLRAVEYAQAIDAEVSNLWSERERVTERGHTARVQLCWSVFDRPDGYRSKQAYWNISNEDLIERAREPHKREAGYNAEARLKARAELRTAVDTIARINERLNVLHDIWIEHSWPRFIECLTHNGHIHRWTGCSTLRFTSRLGWHPELSGMNYEEAVEKLGPWLCSVCYPDAPVSMCQDKAEADEKCPGSGRSGIVTVRRGMRSWGRCPQEGCTYYGQLTQYGYIRKHKPEGASA